MNCQSWICDTRRSRISASLRTILAADGAHPKIARSGCISRTGVRLRRIGVADRNDWPVSRTLGTPAGRAGPVFWLIRQPLPDLADVGPRIGF